MMPPSLEIDSKNQGVALADMGVRIEQLEESVALLHDDSDLAAADLLGAHDGKRATPADIVVVWESLNSMLERVDELEQWRAAHEMLDERAYERILADHNQQERRLNALEQHLAALISAGESAPYAGAPGGAHHCPCGWIGTKAALAHMEGAQGPFCPHCGNVAIPVTAADILDMTAELKSLRSTVDELRQQAAARAGWAPISRGRWEDACAEIDALRSKNEELEKRWAGVPVIAIDRWIRWGDGAYMPGSRTNARQLVCKWIDNEWPWVAEVDEGGNYPNASKEDGECK